MPGNTTIGEMIAELLAQLRKAGYQEHTIWSFYMPAAARLAKYYRATGRTCYDPIVTEEYLQMQRERHERGEIQNYCYKIQQTSHKLNEIYLTGKISVVPVFRGTRFILNEANGRLVDHFLNWKKYGSNTKDDAAWAVRKYLFYMEQRGHASITDVSIEEAQSYLFQLATEVKLSSLHTILLYLRTFYVFLKEANIPAPDCTELFSYRVYREMPVQSYVTDTELEKILSIIDTDTVAGKRNKAIILLAATTGMRACDIIRLRLSDIDWRRGEIRILQSKTKQPVALPLVPDAGEAVMDYILNARPQSDCPEVFLRLLPPCVAIMDAVCIGDMFKKYQKKAGIVRQPFDGKGFHGLRRRLAKKLIVNGTPLTTVAQILGHQDLKSSRQYLSLDTGNLKECALDFSEIPVERKELV